MHTQVCLARTRINTPCVCLHTQVRLESVARLYDPEELAPASQTPCAYDPLVDGTMKTQTSVLDLVSGCENRCLKCLAEWRGGPHLKTDYEEPEKFWIPLMSAEDMDKPYGKIQARRGLHSGSCLLTPSVTMCCCIVPS